MFKASAEATSKAVMLAITVAAARWLNADQFGILAFATATGWLLTVATDAGLSMYLAREVARRRTGCHQLLVDVVGLRTGLAFLAATGTVLAAPDLVPSHWILQFVVLVTAQLAGGVAETVSHYFRGIERAEIESAIQAAQRLVMVVWALLALWLTRRLDYLAVAMLVPTLGGLLVSAVIAMRMSSRDRAEGSKPEGLSIPAFFSGALPLGAGALLSALYFRCDVYFIQHFHGFQPVGAYNAVFRLVEAMRLLPAAAMAVLFPRLVQATGVQSVAQIGGRLTAIGAALGVVCGLAGPILVPLLYGEAYAYAWPAFSILCGALPLFFLNYALTHQVIGWNGQRGYMTTALVALAGNIAVNIALVPSMSLVGAAIGTVLTELIVTLGCGVMLWRQSSRAAAPSLVAVQQ